MKKITRHSSWGDAHRQGLTHFGYVLLRVGLASYYDKDGKWSPRLMGVREDMIEACLRPPALYVLTGVVGFVVGRLV